MALTHWKKLSNPNYLGAYSIEDNKDLILTISVVRQEEVIGPDGKKEECIVCYFSDSEKPMILNSTNAKMIQKLLGTPYIEQWAGHKVQIGVEKVKAFGDVVEALRIRKFLPILIYSRSGDTFTKVDDPASLPTDTTRCCAFSPDSKYLFVGYIATPYFITYKNQNGTFVKINDSLSTPSGAFHNCAWGKA